ncbi:unnamed protein product [Acanthosepion pharaonis]|uniref:Uncharacterized protein n=1 Tax=Acanthosepion pharaonis TaxID=158019 RepID=A0A812ANW5_ACAPH|nr:unnamed protein product [Sepia pharaonis]
MLKQALKPYKAVVAVNLYKDALWSRIMMSSYSNRLNAFKVTVSFFVYYPSLPFVIVKQLKDPLLSILMEEMLLIFNYTNYSKMRFSGRHIGSLATMALNHMTQTKSTLLLDVDKKRKAPVEDTWIDDPRIIFVNKEQIQQREEAIAENFGDGELPILKQLEYVLTYPESDTFQGLSHFCPLSLSLLLFVCHSYVLFLLSSFHLSFSSSLSISFSLIVFPSSFSFLLSFSFLISFSFSCSLSFFLSLSISLSLILLPSFLLTFSCSFSISFSHSLSFSFFHVLFPSLFPLFSFHLSFSHSLSISFSLILFPSFLLSFSFSFLFLFFPSIFHFFFLSFFSFIK